MFYKYIWGSQLYGLTNKQSDKDYLIIFENEIEKNNYIKERSTVNDECWTWNEFQEKLNQHDLKALEVYYANQGTIKTHLFYYCNEYQFKLNLQQLRKSVSAVVSNAHVKARKKFQDKNIYIGLKSYYHCIRILIMFTYLAKNGRFNPCDFKNELDYVYTDIVINSQNKDPDSLWDQLESKYKYMLKSLQHTFKLYCPK